MNSNLQTSFDSSKMIKKNQKLMYPHPILRTLDCVEEQKLTYSPLSFQPSFTKFSETVSAKILKPSHMWPQIGAPFSLILHPYHPGVHVQQQLSSIQQCKNCSCILTNKTTSKTSINEVNCKLCSTPNQIEPHHMDHFYFSGVFDVKNSHFRHIRRKSFLFLIQANEHLFKQNIHQTIIQCIQGLKLQSETSQKTASEESFDTFQTSPSKQQKENTEQYSIGFILFDAEKAYILNLHNHQIVAANPSQFTTSFPISMEELFMHLSQISIDIIFQLTSQLMYEAYENRHSCFDAVNKMLTDAVNKMWNCEGQKIKDVVHVKTFLYSDCQKTTIGSNNQIFAFGDNFQSGKVYRRYNVKNCKKVFYYQLFHSLTQQIHYNVQMQIFTINHLTPKCSSPKSNMICSNTSIVVDFSWKEGLLTQIKQIPIQIILTDESRQRVINYIIIPEKQTMLEPYRLNDQAFFYTCLLKSKTEKKHNKRYLDKKIDQILSEIEEENQGSTEYTIPRNLVNFLLYSFLLKSYEKIGKVGEFIQWCRGEGLETVCKQLYPKVYNFQPRIKSLKFKSSNFDPYSIRVVDNGQFIGIVIGRQVTSRKLKDTFGVYHQNQLLNLYEIPQRENPSNQCLRSLIEILRERNELYYLYIKIITLYSQEYYKYYGNTLYEEGQHRKYLKKLFAKQSNR